MNDASSKKSRFIDDAPPKVRLVLVTKISNSSRNILKRHCQAMEGHGEVETCERESEASVVVPIRCKSGEE